MSKTLDSRWQGHFLQPVAFPEGVLADGLQTLVECERGHHGIMERLVTNGFHRCWKGESTETLSIVESRILDVLQRLGQRERL